MNSSVDNFKIKINNIKKISWISSVKNDFKKIKIAQYLIQFNSIQFNAFNEFISRQFQNQNQ